MGRYVAVQFTCDAMPNKVWQCGVELVQTKLAVGYFELGISNYT